MNPIHTLLLFPFLSLSMAACAQEPSPNPGQDQPPVQAPAPSGLPAALLGCWLGTGDDHERLEFKADGTVLADGVLMAATCRGDRLTIEAGGQRVTATWRVAGDELTLALRRPDGSAARETYRRVEAAAPAREQVGAVQFELPVGWSVGRREGDIALINPGFAPTDTLDALIVVAVAPLADAARRQAITAVLQAQLPQVAVDLREQQVEADLRGVVVQAMALPNRAGAQLQVPGRAGGQQPVTVWLGATKDGRHSATVLLVVVRGKEDSFLPGARQLLSSIEFGAAAARAPAAGGGELAGLEFGHASFGSGSSLTTVYRFAAGGRAHRRTMFSSSIGGTDSEAGGGFEQRGDQVTIRIGADTVEATIERQGGQIVALRIGRALYRRS